MSSIDFREARQRKRKSGKREKEGWTVLALAKFNTVSDKWTAERERRPWDRGEYGSLTLLPLLLPLPPGIDGCRASKIWKS